jgi:hypothetical protein
MPSATPANLAARERLRDHQTTAARAVAALSAAVAGLDATSTHRNKLVAAQDSFVAAMEGNGLLGAGTEPPRLAPEGGRSWP